MKAACTARVEGAGRFRRRLFITMTLVVTVITVAAVVLVERRMEADLRRNLEQRFESEFDAVLAVQDANNTAILDRCRALVRSPRIHAAIEDDGMDLLYSIARDELRTVLPLRGLPLAGDPAPARSVGPAFRASCFRFLDARGALIPPPPGEATPDTFADPGRLAMDRLPAKEEYGYIFDETAPDGGRIHQTVVAPIVSSETGEALAALVLVFDPVEIPGRLSRLGVLSGIWSEGRLDIKEMPPEAKAAAGRALAAAGAAADRTEGALQFDVGGAPFVLHFRRLNPAASFHPGVLVSLFPMAESLTDLRRVRWEIVGAGVLLLIGGLLASHLLSRRLSAPVERLEIVSSANAAGREKAEAALELTHEELRERNRELHAALEDLKAAQQRVIEQERLRALGQMASGVAHDFNNTLVPILGFSDLLQNSPRMFDEERDTAMSYIGMIHTAALDAAKVVSRLREFYRKPADGEALEPVDLEKLVKQTVTLTRPRWKDQAQARSSTIRVTTELQPGIEVLGDESALREALTNLIFNAVDAMPAGGGLTIRTRCEGGSAVLEVSDTGTGMTEEVRQRCLEPFFSTKGERGTGLGLSMVFGIVQRHCGKIDIRSQPGAGTTFVLTIPLRPAGSGAPAATGSDNAAPRNLSVLVVDDEEPVREFVSVALAADGHHVEVASDGVTGLRRFRDGVFDVVITDKAMPGMSGDQLASAMKMMRPGTGVILLTGFGQFIDKADVPGIDALLSKPVGIQALRDALASTLKAA